MELETILNYLNTNFGDLASFVAIMVLLFVIRSARSYLQAKQVKEELSVIEMFALQAVQFAEVLQVTERLTQTGLDKKQVAVDRLQKHLASLGIKADLKDLDESIETAWYREFYNR